MRAGYRKFFMFGQVVISTALGNIGNDVYLLDSVMGKCRCFNTYLHP